MSRYVIDIEADDLYEGVTQVWVIVLKDIDTGELYKQRHPTKKNVAKLFKKAELLIGHNIIGYDIPALEKIYGLKFKGKKFDTLTASTLANPDRRGGHSLASWGTRFKLPKGKHTDFSVFSEEMVEYCVRDVNITFRLYEYLSKGMVNWSESLDLEHSIQEIISEQERYGVFFDINKANNLVKELDDKLDILNEQILEKFSMDLEIPYTVPVNKPFLMNGSYRDNVVKWYPNEEDRSNVGGPFTRIEFLPLELSKIARVKKQLLRLGWKPTFFTEKGAPKLSKDKVMCPNLAKVVGGVGVLLSEWYILSHRRNQIRGWILNIRPDGRLTASAIVNGTNTGRMTHRLVANVPKAKPNVIYGTEMRSLFTVPKGKVLIGIDAAGLELRMLCHYMGDREYIKVLLEDDIHIHNMKLAGLSDRDQAKTMIYGFNYGAGDPKLGLIVGGGKKEGKKIREALLEGLPALGGLIDSVKKASKKGFLRGLDGRKVWMRKDARGKVATHKALNTLLQAAGSIVMKQAAIICYNEIKQLELDAHEVINYHDEFQYEVLERDKEVTAKIMEDSIRKAGEHFNLRLPLEGESKSGTNWSMTH